MKLADCAGRETAESLGTKAAKQHRTAKTAKTGRHRQEEADACKTEIAYQTEQSGIVI